MTKIDRSRDASHYLYQFGEGQGRIEKVSLVSQMTTDKKRSNPSDCPFLSD